MNHTNKSRKDNKEIRKVPREYENPIENLLLDLADAINPLFKSLKFTPNGLTTLSILFGMASVYYLYNYDLSRFTIFYILCYFFDVADGNYARTYNMVSDFGGKYSLIGIQIVSLMSGLVMYDKYDISEYPWVSIILTFLGLMTILFVTSQEKMNMNSPSSIFSLYKQFVPEAPENMMTYIRFFGPSTSAIGFITAAWFLNDMRNESIINLIK